MPTFKATTCTILLLLPSALTSGIPLVVSPGLNVSTSPNITAHLPTCTNLTLAPTIPCYTTLNTTAYLLNYNLTSSEVCAPDEPFSKCLLQFVYESPGTDCVPSGPGTTKCQPFDCTVLNSTTCVQPLQSNQTGITKLEAAAWYAVWNVYAVHAHIAAWATALNQTSSEPAILAAVNPRVANNATGMLTTLIKKYSIDTNADKALLGLISKGTGTGEPAYGNARVRGEASTLSGPQWRGVLVQRLSVELALVMESFEAWLDLMVRGGAYSTRGLSGGKVLGKKLAGG